MTTAEEQFIKCPCNHCGNHLEFLDDPANDGLEVECPTCGMTTRLFLPGCIPLISPSARLATFLKRQRLNITLLIAALIIFLVWLALRRVEGKDAIEVAKGLVGLGGGVLALAVIAFLMVLAVLWLIFPFFVYHQLNRIKQEGIRIRESSERIEDHTRKLAETKRSDS